MKRVLWGVVWYIVIVQLLGLVMGFVMSTLMTMEETLAVYSQYQIGLILMICTLVFVVFGTIKGFLPGTKKNTESGSDQNQTES